MQKNWKEKNVDLALLTARIGDFFKKKDFEAVKGETSTGYQILAQDSPRFKIIGGMTVTIEGKPDDFTVGFELDKEKHPIFLPMFLETMLFGGYLMSRRLKSEETWMNLEKEFWNHAENAVLQLSNSAKNSGPSSE